jgi:hypothetical protein
MVMVTQMIANLFSGRRLRAEVDAAMAAAVEDARESGSLAVPEDLETLGRSTRARLSTLVRRSPKDIEIATELLRQQIDELQRQVAELRSTANQANALGRLHAYLVRLALARRTRRTVREAAALRRQVVRHEQTRQQLEQWLDTRVQLVCTEYLRAKRRADYAAGVAISEAPQAETTALARRPLALASIN